MPESPSIDALRDALAPVEALRGEQSQLESWVGESFAALDSLHDELSQWQRDLTRQQALLDQRQAAADDASEQQLAIASLEQLLADALEKNRQLEQENAEQLQALDELDRQLAVAKTEMRVVRRNLSDLATTTETDRRRTDEERRQWLAEIREFRLLAEQQSDLLQRLTIASSAPDPSTVTSFDFADDSESAEPDDADKASRRAAELRHRASQRRTGQNRTA